MTQKCNGKVVASISFCGLLSHVTNSEPVKKTVIYRFLRTSGKEFDFLADAGKAKKYLAESIKFS